MRPPGLRSLWLLGVAFLGLLVQAQSPQQALTAYRESALARTGVVCSVGSPLPPPRPRSAHVVCELGGERKYFQ